MAVSAHSTPAPAIPPAIQLTRKADAYVSRIDINTTGAAGANRVHTKTVEAVNTNRCHMGTTEYAPRAHSSLRPLESDSKLCFAIS